MDRSMFTVIIQNDKTTESFLEHQSLFVDAINDGRVAVCKWDESGRNIDEALPELHSVINDTHLWRAIIVRYIDGDSMSECKSHPDNPYDFAGDNEKFDPSSIPLIRLTQMLGGIPPVTPKFEFVEETDDSDYDESTDSEDIEKNTPVQRKRKFFYKPIIDNKAIKEQKEKEKTYGMDGRPPVSILIVSVRRDYNRDVDGFNKAFDYKSESDSSRFWDTNQYPSICRFLVCDYINEGMLQREADEFNLWFSVMLLATNTYNSDIISAYKLYRLRTVWDKELMTESFQKTVNRLRDAYKIIKEDLNKDFVYRSDVSDTLPKFTVEIPVVIKHAATGDRQADPKAYHMLADDQNFGNGDIFMWDDKCEVIEETYKSSVKNAERSLDKSSETVRTNSIVDENDAQVFGKYQEEDLETEIDRLFSTIIRQQSTLPNGNVVDSEGYNSAKAEVRSYLFRRVRKQNAVLLFVITALLSVIAGFFSLLFKQAGSSDDMFMIVMIILAFCLVSFLSILIVLIAQKIKLNSLISSFNKVTGMAFQNIVANVENYKNYVSNIASHSKGVSYLAWSKKKKENIIDIHEMRHAHLKAITVMLNKLKSWTKAYHLDVDFTSARITQPVDFNVKIAPIENKLYAFEADMNYPVEVNNSGIMLQSPYNFACKIEICREELYGNK